MNHTAVNYTTITDAHEGQRIDNFLLAHYRRPPKSLVYKLLRTGQVRVNKKRIAPSYRLVEGDEIRLPPVKQPDKVVFKSSHRMLEAVKSRILFENEQLLILNKPSGIAVHGGSGLSGGVIDVLKELYPHEKHLELVHRIDRDTSGCLIMAKKRSVLKILHEAFRANKVKKTYLALTKGHWSKKECHIDAPLNRYQLKSGERLVSVDKSNGKPSVTDFTPIKQFEKAALVEARPKTGRTHQIRVHCQYAGHPIALDSKYGDDEFSASMKALGLKRLFLHAYRIEFQLEGELFKFKAPLDKDLEALLDKLI